jgi:predicted AAA+ superfamily ATPase
VLFEGFIASEISKAQINTGGRRELYYFRDQQGLEVDCLMLWRGGNMALIERKATPQMAASLRQLGAAMKRKRGSTVTMEMLPVHQAPKAGTSTQAVAPGVRALPWERFVAEL